MEQAVAEFDMALGLDSQLTEAYYQRGNALVDLGELQRAIEDYNQAIRLDARYADAYDSRGTANYRLGQAFYFYAIRDFGEAVRLDPRFAHAYYNRARVRDDMGQFNVAVQDYDEAIRLDPDLSDAYNHRGNARGELGRLQRAIEDYDEAIRLSPDHALAYHNRGSTYSRLEEFWTAIEDYDEAIRLNPENGRAYLDRGFSNSKIGEFERAIEDYGRAIGLGPIHARSYALRALAYSALDMDSEAQQDFDRAVELGADRDALIAEVDQIKKDAVILRLPPLERIGRAVQAAETFEAAGTIPLLEFTAGYAEYVQANEGMEKAGRELTRYVGLNPDDVQALLLKVRMARIQGLMMPSNMTLTKTEDGELPGQSEFSEMEHILDRVLELDADNAEAHYWRAQVHGMKAGVNEVWLPAIAEDELEFRRGDLESAVALAALAVESEPDNLTYREGLARYLLADQRAQEAKDVLFEIAGEDHPIYRLLADLEQLALPEGATFDASESLIQAHINIRRPRLAGTYNHAFLRAAVYWIPAPASEVEAFYQRRWDNFKLEVIERDDLIGATQILWASLFEWDGPELRPSSERPSRAGLRPESGLVFTVSEARDLSPSQQEFIQRRVPIPVGEVISMIVIINYRTFESPGP